MKAAENVIDLTEANFPEVIGLSRQVPVLVDFWADWCAPCRQLAPVLDKLARELKGRFVLAKVNADQQPLVTQQFGVRGLPTLKLVWQGQLAGELVGAQPEAAIRKLLAPFLGEEPPAEEGAAADDFLARVMEAVQAGQVEQAVAALRAHLEQDGKDGRARDLLVDLLLQEDRLDEVKAVLDAAPDQAAPALRRSRALLAFAHRTRDLPPLRELEATAGASSEQRYQLALRLVMANRVEEGLDLLLALMRADRAWGEDAARKALLEVLEVLGRDDPLTARYRRQMANYLL